MEPEAQEVAVSISFNISVEPGRWEMPELRQEEETD